VRASASLAICTATMLLLPCAGAAEAGHCAFDKSALVFEGDVSRQARCLLSPVKMYARLDEPLEVLPENLGRLVGQPVSIARRSLRKHLESIGLQEDDVGGELDGPISETIGGHPARYFVIHDTSTPYFGDKDFPADLNGDAVVNNLDFYRSSTDAKAHVFVNREGAVYLGHDFSSPWRATKLELRFAGKGSRGRFIHVELVQPRRRDSEGGLENNAVAPQPGFSEAQYERLALLYVAASLRAGTWLTPAYHAVLDSGFNRGHDDPQHFDLAAWDARLGALLEALEE
jgi:hypothetical protein